MSLRAECTLLKYSYRRSLIIAQSGYSSPEKHATYCKPCNPCSKRNNSVPEGLKKVVALHTSSIKRAERPTTPRLITVTMSAFVNGLTLLLQRSCFHLIVSHR